MDNKIYKFFIIFFLVVISSFYFLKEKKIPQYKVLDVVGADRFYIDINKNNKIEENELVKLKYIKAFSPYKTDFSENISKKLGISLEDYLKIGVLANSWAKSELLNKYVEVIGLEKCIYENNSCYVEIKYKNHDLAQYLLANGLAYMREDSRKSKYFSSYNFFQISNNLKSIKDIDFVLINLKNGIAHKLNCEFANKIGFAKLEINRKNSHKRLCKICSRYNSKFFEFKQSKRKYLKSINKTFDNVDIYLINPLEFNKPQVDCNNDFCKRLIKEINSSKESIDIALYGFGEQDEILKALINAKSRGVKIRSVIDDSKNSDIFSKNDIFINEFNPVVNNLKSLMHNKFFIFDNKMLLTGSVNISAAGSGGYNSNLAFFIKDENLAKRYKHEFEQMYGGIFSRSKNKVDVENNNDIQAYFSPSDNVFKTVILPLIKEAKSNIYVSAFYLTDIDFILELISAKKRGVEVLIIIDSLCANSFRNKINLLRENKIPVIVENWGGKNHEKTIVFDNEILLSGSCNFSKSGFYKNDENILVFKNKDMAKFYSDYFLYLFNSINKKFLYLFPSAEGKGSINSCFDGLDNDYDGKIDANDSACK